MIDTKKMRESFVGHDNATHYEGCEYGHPCCAVAKLCNELEDKYERATLAIETLHESYDEGSPQAMALAMAILDGDRNAIAQAKQDMQKRQERAETMQGQGKQVACDRSDGTFNVHRESETCEVCEPDWLPAPDTMPEELAPAQMVETRIKTGNKIPVRRVDIVPWGLLKKLGGEYRPLYSDSGHALCSAEGLEEWARFVATDGDGRVYQYDCHASHDAEVWYPTNRGKWFGAPESHRRPGPWIESIMEVMR